MIAVGRTRKRLRPAPSERFWLVLALLVALPLVADHVWGWYLRGAAALAGLGG
jgi:hypothetical protein